MKKSVYETLMEKLLAGKASSVELAEMERLAHIQIEHSCSNASNHKSRQKGNYMVRPKQLNIPSIAAII